MKLVVSDLDGTLLNDDSEVSNETIQAIKKLKDNGVEFAIATGRSFNSTNKIRKKSSSKALEVKQGLWKRSSRGYTY